jgi:hypothetical protein
MVTTDHDADPDADAAEGTCEVLYGNPVEQTGLTTQECRPECAACGDAHAPEFSADDLRRFREANLSDPPDELTGDPYESDPPTRRPGAVCGLQFEDPQTYRLDTYDSAEAATAAGAAITHFGECGLCSSLQDLATYVEHEDLTDPVRECGLTGIRDGEEANIACLTDLGFSLPCAQIWYYNTLNTRNECLELCLPAINEPYHQEDGSLHPCLQCDEDRSGPVFKAIAGRTRRNSGLPSAICRPCSTVSYVAHEY